MPSKIKDMSGQTIQSILKELTEVSFSYSQQGPKNSIFCMEAKHGDTDSPFVQWVTMTRSGLLIITSSLTNSTFWSLPSDLLLGSYEREDAIRELKKEYENFIQNIGETLCSVNYEYDVNIELDESEQRLYVFLSNHQTKNDLTNALYALEILLPQLVNAM